MGWDDEIDVSDLVESRRGTEQLDGYLARTASVRSFLLRVVEGTSAGMEARSAGEKFSIGSDSGNDLSIDDSAASRFHCEIRVGKHGAWLRDLRSKNGTVLDGVPIREGALREGSLIHIGRSVLSFHFGADEHPLQVSSRGEFGSLVGVSVAMRSVFALLQRAAESDATVLIEGETGTGKESVAESVHRASARADAPFLVVDCAALPPSLLESEFFGHERGAFTGADTRRIGVFEEADGGSVFLDEIGELPLDLQPRLLRVLERREVRRVGSNAHRPVDVRVIAATNRDLRQQVNDGHFRADLYFRLAVVKVSVPPLRERPEDIPALAERLLTGLGADDPERAALLDGGFMQRLQRGVWPGNVRELRNYLERCLVLKQAAPFSEQAPAAAPGGAGDVDVDVSLTYSDAKRRLLDEFERNYLGALLSRHDGNVSKAARAAGMDRVYVHKLLHKHGLKR